MSHHTGFIDIVNLKLHVTRTINSSGWNFPFKILSGTLLLLDRLNCDVLELLVTLLSYLSIYFEIYLVRLLNYTRL